VDWAGQGGEFRVDTGFFAQETILSAAQRTTPADWANGFLGPLSRPATNTRADEDAGLGHQPRTPTAIAADDDLEAGILRHGATAQRVEGKPRAVAVATGETPARAALATDPMGIRELGRRLAVQLQTTAGG
jgi:hypothetical protein